MTGGPPRGPRDGAARSHLSAVALLPPDELWPPLQAIRRRHDRHVRRWPPHVNLLYPFLPPAAATAALPTLAAAAAGVSTFRVTLAEARSFDHGRGRHTVWLAPAPPAPLVALQAELRAAFPGLDDLGRFPHGFTPHLSVGQAQGPAALARLLTEIAAGWEPLGFEVREVVLLCRGPDTPFAVAGRCPLGRSRTPEEAAP